MEALSKKDLEIFREKARAFHRAVKVPLDSLQAEKPPENPRQLDEKNVTRLVDSFGRGCYRLEPENHVPVKIPASELATLPSGDNIQPFVPEHPLTLLHGQHRIEAARRFFTGSDRWWIADIYSEDLSSQAANHIREHDPNSARFYDGDILRQILISIEHGDEERKEKFMGRFSGSKQDWVTRLLGQPEDFLAALRDLIPFTGLWTAVQIGTFPRLFTLRCPEELTRYIRQVKTIWSFIVTQDEEQSTWIDPNTVHLLQGRCPALSSEDHAFIQTRMLAGDLFPAVKSQAIRSQILNRLLSINQIISSIHTFLEDTKYLEPCARILKKLLPSKCKASLSQHFSSLRADQTTLKVQTSEFSYEERSLFSSSYASWLAYRQLWLFALRHFPVMDGKQPRKDTTKSKPWCSSLQLRWWVHISTLAADTGYKRVRRLYRDNKAADLSAIEECIHRILPPDYYEVGQEEVQHKAKLIYVIINEIKHGQALKSPPPELTSDQVNCRPDISDKCGRPRVSTYKADEKLLFLDHIYNSYDVTQKRYLTSFAITRDFFHKFFGAGEDDLDQPFIRVNPTVEDRRMNSMDSRPVDPPDAPDLLPSITNSSRDLQGIQTPAEPPDPARQQSDSSARPVDNVETRLTLYRDPASKTQKDPPEVVPPAQEDPGANELIPHPQGGKDAGKTGVHEAPSILATTARETMPRQLFEARSKQSQTWTWNTQLLLQSQVLAYCSLRILGTWTWRSFDQRLATPGLMKESSTCHHRHPRICRTTSESIHTHICRTRVPSASSRVKTSRENALDLRYEAKEAVYIWYRKTG